MQIIVIGANHTTASVDVREKLSYREDEAREALRKFKDSRSMFETILVSTCNRTEVYTLTTSRKAAVDYICHVFASRAGLSVSEMQTHLYVHEGQAAARHAMKVAAGLDSIVVGETQILGQMKQAFALAQECGTVGSMLQKLFQQVVEVGKRVHTETSISKTPVSVAYAAVQLAKKIYGSSKARSALVLGAGSMAKLAAEHLASQFEGPLWIANRTFGRAVELAEAVGGKAIPWEDVETILSKVDIVLTATGAKDPVLSLAQVQRAQKQRRGQPQFIVDIGLPRNVETSVSQVKDVFLFDVDDLRGVIQANFEERAREAVVASELIEQSLTSFENWVTSLRMVPVISAVRAKGANIQRDVMHSLENKLPDLNDREKKLIAKHMMSIVNQLLKDPIEQMKEMGTMKKPSISPEGMASLFGVEAELSAVDTFSDVLPTHSMLEDFLSMWRGGESAPSTPAEELVAVAGMGSVRTRREC
jgi:glutamyl-tRNA reductase